MKLKYIKTMDFTFEDVFVLNCKDIDELCYKIRRGDVIEVNNMGSVEYINSAYIMFFA
jgi:hypothetical protein